MSLPGTVGCGQFIAFLFGRLGKDKLDCKRLQKSLHYLDIIINLAEEN